MLRLSKPLPASVVWVLIVGALWMATHDGADAIANRVGLGALAVLVAVAGVAAAFSWDGRARLDERVRALEEGIRALEAEKQRLTAENRDQVMAQAALTERTELVLRRAHQQGAVAKLVHRALAGVPVEQLRAMALEIVAAELGVECVDLAEFVPSEGALVVVAERGWSPSALGTSVDLAAGSIAKEAFDGTDVLVIEDLRGEVAQGRASYQARLGAVSAVFVAVPAPRRSFGLLGAYASRVQVFSSGDLSLLRALASALAMAIERLRMSEARRELERRFEDLLDHASDVVVSVAPTGRILYANRAARALMGMAETDDPGAYALRDVIDPAAWAAFKELVVRARAGESLGRLQTTIRGGAAAVATMTSALGGVVRAAFRTVSSR